MRIGKQRLARLMAWANVADPYDLPGRLDPSRMTDPEDADAAELVLRAAARGEVIEAVEEAEVEDQGLGIRGEVINELVRLLRAATPEKPLSKDVLVDLLAARFPTRPRKSLANTVKIHVPSRLRVYRLLPVLQNHGGFWIERKRKL